jgi:outer membrane protein
MKPNLVPIFLVLVCLGLAGTIGRPAQAQPAAVANDRVELQNFTLKQCVEYAINHSVLVKNAQADVQTAKAQVGLVRADGLPQVNGSYSINGNIKPQVFFFPNSGTPPLGNPDLPVGEFIAVPAQAAFSGNMGVTASQLLFDGAFFLGLKAANVYQELSQKGLTRSKIEVAAAVSKAYYGLVVSTERLALIDNNYQRVAALLRETRALNEQGFVEKIDVDRIEVTFNNLKIEKQKLERFVTLSQVLLKFQMGLREEDVITVSENLQGLQLAESALQAKAEGIDPAQRIEYSALETQRQLDLMNIRRNRLEYLPKLNLLGNYSGAAAQPELGRLFEFNRRWVSFASIGLGLQVPIFDGLRKKYTGEQRRLALVKTENSLQDLRRSIGIEAKQAILTLQNAVDNMAAQQANMKLAAEVARVTKIKYKEGVGSNIEVITAENEYKTAETNYYNALYEALVAKVDLDKAQGKLLEN